MTVSVTVRLADGTTPAAAVAVSVYVMDFVALVCFGMEVTTSCDTLLMGTAPLSVAPLGAARSSVSVTPAGMSALSRAVIF